MGHNCINWWKNGVQSISEIILRILQEEQYLNKDDTYDTYMT